jgi:hypothetical protein
MYDYAIDRSSGQYKDPFNEINNEARVFTYQDRAIITPNSDTPYSTMFMDLRAEPLVLSVPAVDPKRYYSVMLCDGNTYNYGYMGSRTTGSDPATTWWWDRTGRVTRRLGSRKSSNQAPSFPRRRNAPNSSIRTTWTT